MTSADTLTLELPATHETEKLGVFACSDLLGHVTVLFVMKDSIYKSLGIDCYDAERNALTYTGNNPVVAHPPCQLWGKMAKVNYTRWGGEHNKPGNDGGCFRFALDTVNRCGGGVRKRVQEIRPKRRECLSPSGGPRLPAQDRNAV